MLIIFFKPLAVATAAPVADFIGVPVTGSVPFNVVFTDLSTNAPTSWLWDFGDGYTSTQQNPTHQYATDGVYSVTLTVTNGIGSDSLTMNNYITALKGDAHGDSWLGVAFARKKAAEKRQERERRRKMRRRRNIEAAITMMLNDW